MLELIFASYWYWLFLAVFLLLLEALLPGIFLLWLGLGAAMVGIFLLLVPQAGLAWQLFALVLSISAAVAAGLKWQKKTVRSQPNSLNQGLEGYIGRTARVSQAFSHGLGRVSLEDSSFPARTDETTLELNQVVTITGIHGAGFIVAAKHN